MDAERRMIERLRRLRGERAWGASLSGEFESLARGVRRADRAVGGLGRSWAELVGEELARDSEPTGMRAGTLSVRCGSAAARHRLDVFLRGGGIEKLRAACGATLRRVKLV